MHTPAHHLADRFRMLYHRDHTPGDLVWIAELRPEVGGRREDQDAALELLGLDDAHLMPASNQLALEDWQRAGSVQFGDQTKHLIAFDG